MIRRSFASMRTRLSLECLEDRRLLSANVLLNELLVNPPGTPHQPWE
jgi:hypothetical protein